MPLGASRFKNLRSVGIPKPPTFFAQRRQEQVERKEMIVDRRKQLSHIEALRPGAAGVSLIVT